MSPLKNPAQSEAQPIEVIIKFLGIRPETPNHLVVSQGLAQSLGIAEGQDVIISNVYAKIEEIDLDKI